MSVYTFFSSLVLGAKFLAYNFTTIQWTIEHLFIAYGTSTSHNVREHVLEKGLKGFLSVVQKVSSLLSFISMKSISNN